LRIATLPADACRLDADDLPEAIPELFAPLIEELRQQYAALDVPAHFA
jgi:hypothetical protein